MVEEKEENFNIYIDKTGRIPVPKHIRANLGIVGKPAEVNVTIRVNKVYHELEEES